MAQDPSYFANLERQRLINEAMARETEEYGRQKRVRDATDTIDKTFADTFTPGFYEGRQKAFTDYYKPQIDDQFADAGKTLTYWLTDRGLLDSSVRNDKRAELQKQYDTGLRGINDSALGLVEKNKSDVAAAKAGLISDARDSADPGYAGTAAQSSVQSLQAPETYSPLADLFGTFTSALSQQAAHERAGYMSGGEYKPALGYLFRPNPDSVRNTR